MVTYPLELLLAAELMQRISTIALTVCCSLVSVADAHPGHGTTDTGSFAHYISEPQHAAAVGMVAVLTTSSLLVWRNLRRRATRLTD